MSAIADLRSVIATRVREAREAAGMSQRALSRATGISQPHISKIEDGTANVTVSALETIASALGLKASQLVN